MTTLSAERDAAVEDVSAIVLAQADRLFHGEVTKQRMTAADRGDWPAEIWKAVEQAGLPVALVPEANGGAGLSARDALTLIRRVGYHTVPAPLPETIIAAALWAEAGGDTVPGALSLAPAANEYSISIARGTSGFVLHGRAERVPWGAQVGHILVFAHDTSGVAQLALVPSKGLTAIGNRNLANEARDTLTFDSVALPTEAVRRAPQTCADGFLALGALVRAQQMVGAMERCLDYAIGYAMERQQFGRPIAKFQAVQHMLADAAGQYAAASAAAELAAEKYGMPDLAFTVAIAKARVGEATGKVTEVCHQVHGAIGFTQEHPLHFATRRLWSWRDEFGHEAYWQERIGRSVCEAGGEALWPLLVGT